MRRRDFSRVRDAQQPGKIPVVGMIWHAGSEKKTLVGYLRKPFADPSTGLLD